MELWEIWNCGREPHRVNHYMEFGMELRLGATIFWTGNKLLHRKLTMLNQHNYRMYIFEKFQTIRPSYTLQFKLGTFFEQNLSVEMKIIRR